jgi:hypothetical protein
MTSSQTQWRCGLFAALLVTIVADGALAQSRGSSPIFNAPSRSFGQARSPFTTRPTISPYFNLLRRGNPVVNYYGLVRPEQDFRAANDQFRQQFRDVDRKLESVEQREGATNLGITGHRVQFLSNTQGGEGSVTSTLTDRDGRMQKLPPTPGSRIAPSGHSAYFNNPGTYYPFPNRR